MALTATPIDAGTYPSFVVDREDEYSHRWVASHEKGGWIELLWERKVAEKVVTENRTIQVSRPRALQAMSAMVTGAGPV
jgi:hypothetical protein